jgi:WD40 repeat protein
MTSLLSSNSTRYKLAGQLKGHTESVHSVAMTKGGRILASGGEILSVFHRRKN